MYHYELEIIVNGSTFYDEVWADNSKEAIEDGYDKYPYALSVEIA
jgi:hypothetical protein